MNDDIVIDVKNISKKYTIATDYQADTLREKIVELAKYPLKVLKGEHQKPKTKEYWALKDVSFQVKRGEVLGIIGKNGAGKSTLLKILSRTTEPTSGTITMKGRVASLLEVGTGFNPELTGRENIYLNGAIIGMSKKEINSKFNEIVEFAGIGEFLDTPVKRYSSGMYVRLAFAVAAHLDSDILILDEVLAVGDAEFHKKSYLKMKELVKSCRTIIIVSHDMATINTLCDRVLVMAKGNKLYEGMSLPTISEYLSMERSVNNVSTGILREIEVRQMNSMIQISATFNYPHKLKLACLGFVIKDSLGNPIMGSNPKMENIAKAYAKPTKNGKVTVKVIDPKLRTGKYYISLWFGDGFEDLYNQENALTIDYVDIDKHFNHDPNIGPIKPICQWRFE